MIDNLVITHVAFHIIKKEGTAANAKATEAVLSEQLLVLDNDSSDTLKARIVAALGEDGESIEMELIPDGPKDTFTECCNVLGTQTDEQFLASTINIVSILATTQNHPKIPEGAVLIIKGTSTDANRPCLIILKSEYSKALTTEEGEQLLVKYLDKVFLTDDSKLNKIGFISLVNPALTGEERNVPTNYYFKIFDVNANRGPGEYATYFYKAFLGLQFIATDSILTKRFFSSAKNHILTKTTSPQDKFDKMSQLYTYLLSTRRTTINIADFATLVYADDTEKKRAMRTDLESGGVSKTNFQLDKDFVYNKLKARTFLFGDSAKIRIPVGLLVPDSVEYDEESDSLTLTIKGARGET